ncbi:hypothetical protein VTH8203_00842 [Vibrio thalassae]|uniref:Integrating conjugative element membrane protein, PFL_4697 family n=1 Tax=Vibrio thalassae TaxID=1243014 RepID=A0A240EFD8_9VIBR|nr:DUF4400 domain-containing protein [Vibrio thalassae]SNX47241.1 hypothetical protein VTH8203_00842 [Vibrio thalassae]
MTEQDKNTKRDRKKSSIKIPLISFYLSIIFKVLSIACFAGALCLFIELGMYIFMDDAIALSLERYERISTFTGSAVWVANEDLLTYLQNTLSQFFHLPTFISETQDVTSQLSQLLSQERLSNSYLQWAYELVIALVAAIPDIMALWVIVSYTWMAKVITIISMLIPCLAIIIAGVIDGSVERKINTYKGKRDSQDKIEWWFLALKSSSYTIIFLYIAIPNSLQAGTVMIPSALATAFFARNVVANYKKYF